ncbi:nitroreductase family deazaflavin-dependent oxidoreductase [soil metagenome]
MSSGGYLAPGFIVHKVLNPLIRKLRLRPVLLVAGRKSGRVQEVPINPLKVDGERYLLSPRGETQWVRNLRAAGEGRLRHLTSVESFFAVEVPDEEKPRLVAEYVRRWGKVVKQQFDALPDPLDHPAFRMEARRRGAEAAPGPQNIGGSE